MDLTLPSLSDHASLPHLVYSIYTLAAIFLLRHCVQLDWQMQLLLTGLHETLEATVCLL